MSKVCCPKCNTEFDSEDDYVHSGSKFEVHLWTFIGNDEWEWKRKYDGDSFEEALKIIFKIREKNTCQIKLLWEY